MDNFPAAVPVRKTRRKKNENYIKDILASILGCGYADFSVFKDTDVDWDGVVSDIRGEGREVTFGTLYEFSALRVAFEVADAACDESFPQDLVFENTNFLASSISLKNADDHEEAAALFENCTGYSLFPIY